MKLESLELLLNHVLGSTSVNPDPIVSIYKYEMPDNVKHSGIIYRGFSIKGKNIVDLFTDNEFYTGFQNTIESWSVSKTEAENAAYGNLTDARPIAVVARDEIIANEYKVVMDLSPNAYEWLRNRVMYFVKEELGGYEVPLENSDFFNVIKRINRYAYEKEILIRGDEDSERAFTLCGSVEYLLISTRNFREYSFSKEETEAVWLQNMVFRGASERDKEYYINEDTQVLRIECKDGVLDWENVIRL